MDGRQIATYTCTAGVAEDKTVTVPASALGAVGARQTVTLRATAPYTQSISFTLAVVAAELAALVVTVFCFVRFKGKYHYM